MSASSSASVSGQVKWSRRQSAYASISSGLNVGLGDGVGGIVVTEECNVEADDLYVLTRTPRVVEAEAAEGISMVGERGGQVLAL